MTDRQNLRLPRPIQILTPKHLSLPQHRHPTPSLIIHRINIPTRFNTEPRALASSRRALDSGDIDILSSVELESGFGGVDLEMHAGVWVGEFGEELERLAAGVEGYFGGIGFGYEDVVDVWFGGLENEGGGYVAGEFGYLAEGNSRVV